MFIYVQLIMIYDQFTISFTKLFSKHKISFPHNINHNTKQIKNDLKKKKCNYKIYWSEYSKKIQKKKLKWKILWIIFFIQCPYMFQYVNIFIDLNMLNDRIFAFALCYLLVVDTIVKVIKQQGSYTVYWVLQTTNIEKFIENVR